MVNSPGFASSPEERLARAQTLIGTIIKDKWRLDSLLGVGGMATVFAATHRNKNRAAVKMLHPDLCGNASLRQRFLREGYAANVIEHRGAVKVLDDDIAEDGVAFLVMELLSGETLEARWARKGSKLPVAEVFALADQLLDVLAAGHAKGIVHRDIKPENLFLTREGVLKVLDFGIARVFEGTSARELGAGKQTHAGEVMGTPAFMAPEQALAKWDQVDGRTDLWAVGATMFTLLSGRNVHEGNTANEQLVFSASRPAPPLASVIAGLPRSVTSVVDRALAFAKEQRWVDAKAMQGAVRAAGASLAVHQPAGPPGAASMPSAPRVPLIEAARSDEHPVYDDAAPLSLPSMQAMVDPVALQTQAGARQAERDALAAEIARAQPHLADASRRLGEARKRVAEVQARLTAANNERAALEEWFKSNVGTRTTAADQAREQLNAAFAAFAGSVLTDTTVFGNEFESSREETRTLLAASDTVSHDVTVHETALTSYDETSYRRGVLIVIILAVLFTLLFFSPVIARILADS